MHRSALARNTFAPHHAPMCNGVLRGELPPPSLTLTLSSALSPTMQRSQRVVQVTGARGQEANPPSSPRTRFWAQIRRGRVVYPLLCVPQCHDVC